MDKSAPWIVAVLEIIALYLYADKIWKNDIAPSFMTWIIFLFGICISLGSYVLNEEGQKRGVIKKLLLNPMNACDAFVVIMIIAILVEHNGWTIPKLTFFDFGCLFATFLITAVWIWKRNHFYIFLVTQIVMVIAYFPTMRTLIVEGRNTESFVSVPFLCCNEHDCHGDHDHCNIKKGRTPVRPFLHLYTVNYETLSRRTFWRAQHKILLNFCLMLAPDRAPQVSPKNAPSTSFVIQSYIENLKLHNASHHAVFFSFLLFCLCLKLVL